MAAAVRMGSGGNPWRPEEVTSIMVEQGFTCVCEVPRTWTAPVRLYAGRQA
jgi:hypothetical protein